MTDYVLRPGVVGEVRDGFTLRKSEWRGERLHQWWFNASTGQIRHERLDPPEDIVKRRRALEELRDSRRERAQRADGLHLAARLSASEYERILQKGVKQGDMEGLDWALRQDEFRHAKVSSGKLDRG